uniref:Uncharacterized protein n=1 Tax=Timema cristinae TaxID=61476 RepID=A0A7R9D7X4_TIMCR|nr:unnamed protein product [Timema cristinae]
MMSEHGYHPSIHSSFQHEGTIELFIETLTGTAFEITVSPFDTVLSIKLKIHRVEGDNSMNLDSSLSSVPVVLNQILKFPPSQIIHGREPACANRTSPHRQHQLESGSMLDGIVHETG